MSRKLYYCLIILSVGLFLANNLNAQESPSTNEIPTKQDQTNQPQQSTSDSLDLETTTLPESEEETTVYKDKKKTVKPFNRIYVSGNYRVEIKQGETHSVEVSGGGFLNKMYHVSNNTLKIGVPYRFESLARPVVYVTTPDLEMLKVSGSNFVQSDGLLVVDCLEIKGSGASKIDLELDANCIELNHSGAVTTLLKGNTKILECRQTGASKLRAAELEAERVELLITGAGSAHVNANNVLEVVGSGICKIRYAGEPEMISKRLAGPCRIVKM